MTLPDSLVLSMAIGLIDEVPTSFIAVIVISYIDHSSKFDSTCELAV